MHIDDLSRNFALNVGNGIKIKVRFSTSLLWLLRVCVSLASTFVLVPITAQQTHTIKPPPNQTTTTLTQQTSNQAYYRDAAEAGDDKELLWLGRYLVHLAARHEEVSSCVVV